MDEPLLQLLLVLRRRWLAEGLQPCAPASDEAIREFEERNCIRLSNAMRSYFRVVNGLGPNQLDGLARLWPLTEVRRLPAVYPSALADAGRLLVFGDYNIEGSYWALWLSLGEPACEEHVVALWPFSDEKGYQVAASSEEFFRQYIGVSPESVI
jgi:hypothetical protein